MKIIFIIISLIIMVIGGSLLYIEGITASNVLIFFIGWINFKGELTNYKIEELEKRVKELRGG